MAATRTCSIEGRTRVLGSVVVIKEGWCEMGTIYEILERTPEESHQKVRIAGSIGSPHGASGISCV